MNRWFDTLHALSISSLQWVVGAFVATLGGLMLVSPHQFAAPAFAQLSPQLAWFGPAFLLAGAGLLAVATRGVRFRYVLLAHFTAGGMLLFLAAGFAVTGSWTGTSNFGVVGLGTAVAPLLTRVRPKRAWLNHPGGPDRGPAQYLVSSAQTRGDAFSLMIGLATTSTGLLLLAMPSQFGASVYDLVRSYLPWFGLGFVVAGLFLSFSQIGYLVPSRLDRWAPVPVAGAFLLFGSAAALPGHVWTGIAFYGGFGFALVILAWMRPQLRRLDPGSLRTRLALVLAAAVAVPVLVLAPLYSHAEENQAVSAQLARQQSFAVATAHNVADYLTLHQAALKSLAMQPGLLALSPVEQHLLLQSTRAAYADVNSFGTVAADGDSIARSDDRQGTSWTSGDPVFEAVRRTNQPFLDIRSSPVIDRPVFTFGVPILDARGQFSGMVLASVESSSLALLLGRNDIGDDVRTYLVDATGRVIAHPDQDLVASLADLSSTASVVALMSDPSASGSQRVAGPRGEILASFAHVPDLGWGVVVERSSAVTLAPTRSKLDLLFGGLILLVAAAAWFGVVAANWLSRPLTKLGAAVDGLAAGDDGAPLPVGGLTEVAGLAVAFGTMRARVISHTAELLAANTELEAVNKELEAFSYSVSHDLRAPLRAINGFSRILLEEHADRLGLEAQGYLELVRDNAGQMGTLIDDLLNFSRLSRQGLRKDHVLPADIVRQVLGHLAAEREGRRVEVVVGELLPCRADAALLKQLFMNLLSNALKFTQRRAVGHIEIGCARVQDEVVYFVKDDGAGFDMKYANKLFGVFQRLHRAEDYQGTGVGLAIVKRIVQRHGGRIWADGVLDHGATFSFTLAGAQPNAPEWSVERPSPYPQEEEWCDESHGIPIQDAA